MASNPFDQFDEVSTPANPFDQFDEPAPKKQEGEWSPFGALSDVGKLIYDIPTQTKGAVGALAESFEGDPLAKHDWKDDWQSQAEARTQQRRDDLVASGDATGRLIPGTDFIQRQDIADTGSSTGFSAVSMLPAIGGLALGATGVGAPAGTAIGMAGSGASAYAMDKNMFTRQLLDKANADMQRQHGRAMINDERSKFLQETDGVRSDHALWEAGPEAVGNALGAFGLGKIFSGVARCCAQAKHHLQTAAWFHYRLEREQLTYP